MSKGRKRFDFSLQNKATKIIRTDLEFRFEIFIRSAGVILLVTGFAKIASGFGDKIILDQSDPLFGISFRHLMQLAGMVEIVVAGICFFVKNTRLNLCLIGWLTLNFLAYRATLHLIGWHKPCSCLGNLTDVLHISPTTADWVMKGVLVYLFAGSCVAPLFMRVIRTREG
jgi:hypothetical protein